MARFEIGDKVLIARNGQYQHGWVTPMDKYVGETGTIKSTLDRDGRCIVDTTGDSWWYHSSVLELASKKMTARELYVKLQDEAGFEVGDTVKITDKARGGQFGWANSWNAPHMDITVGKEYVVESICATGISLSAGYCYPFFVLEKVDKPLFYRVTLTEDYNAEVYKDKIIVGCQTIPTDKLKELTEALKKHEV